MAKQQKKSYEASMAELEKLLGQVESDDLGIDELSDAVKKSVLLIKSCKQQLQGIENDIDNSLKDITEE